jgi:hypothetical protein
MAQSLNAVLKSDPEYRNQENDAARVALCSQVSEKTLNSNLVMSAVGVSAISE